MKKIFVIAVLTVLTLTACGKRGKLEFPQPSVFPRTYPAPRSPKTASDVSVNKTPETGEPAQTLLDMQTMMERNVQ